MEQWKQPRKEKNIGTKIISTFHHLILTLNNFVFNCQNYLQIKGYAMGTKCLPNYANIFMDIFEGRHKYPLIEAMSKFYLSFFLSFCSWKEKLMSVVPTMVSSDHGLLCLIEEV